LAGFNTPIILTGSNFIVILEDYASRCGVLNPPDIIKVGRLTHHYDTVLPSSGEPTCVRTGVTAILPVTGEVFDKHLVAGGFVLNGIG